MPVADALDRLLSVSVGNIRDVKKVGERQSRRIVDRHVGIIVELDADVTVTV